MRGNSATNLTAEKNKTFTGMYLWIGGPMADWSSIINPIGLPRSPWISNWLSQTPQRIKLGRNRPLLQQGCYDRDPVPSDR